MDMNEDTPRVTEHMDQKEYEKYVKKITPTHSTPRNMLRAFITGGIICIFAQWITTTLMNSGLDKDTASSWTLLILIGITGLLTGFNLFSKLTKFGGAGMLVPITGFANSVAAPAIEYKKEGQVYGIGCKIFTISGPVILYGILTSWVLGLIYWILKMFGVV